MYRYLRHLMEANMHPATENVLRYFSYEHLPPELQAVSKPFREMAQRIAEASPENPETTVALRKLLEAKDAAVRAMIPPRRLQGEEAAEQSGVAEAARKGFHGKCEEPGCALHKGHPGEHKKG